jgi:hypothetical protein
MTSQPQSAWVRFLAGKTIPAWVRFLNGLTGATDIDIQNLIKERNQRVLVERAEQKIVNIFDDIKTDFPEFHINVIIEKKQSDLFVSPLINTKISSVWETLRSKVGRAS